MGGTRYSGAPLGGLQHQVCRSIRADVTSASMRAIYRPLAYGWLSK